MKAEYAGAHLSALPNAVEGGEEITICRGANLARMVPPEERELGFVSYRVPDSFLEPLAGAELAAWEGSA